MTNQPAPEKLKECPNCGSQNPYFYGRNCIKNAVSWHRDNQKPADASVPVPKTQAANWNEGRLPSCSYQCDPSRDMHTGICYERREQAELKAHAVSKESAPLAEARVSCGRWCLFVRKVCVAMEGDHCREEGFPDSYWNGAMLVVAAAKINGAVTPPEDAPPCEHKMLIWDKNPAHGKQCAGCGKAFEPEDAPATPQRDPNLGYKCLTCGVTTGLICQVCGTPIPAEPAALDPKTHAIEAPPKEK